MDRLIIIDDEPELGRFVSRVAESIGYEVRVTSRPKEFKDLVGQWKPTVIVLDLAMPETDGLELLRWLASENCRAHIVIMSGFDTRVVDTAITIGQERGLNVCYAFNKPVRVQDLKEKLEILKTPKAELIGPTELEHALTEKNLYLAYEPIISFKTGALQGVEALLRWRHPTRGVILPGQFVNLTTEPELATKLTDFTFAEAISQQKAWMQQRLDFQLTINLYPSNIRDDHVVDSLSAQCAEHVVTPDSLTLQVTEAAIMIDTLEVYDVLTRLRLKGFQISIDDFGTGHLSLERLRRLLAMEIKISQSLVSGALTSRDSLVVIKTIMDIARNMNLVVVARGVDTTEHYELMTELGCDMGQGAGIAGPMTADELSLWYEWWKSPTHVGAHI